MSDFSADEKLISVMLAGPGSDAVFYEMQSGFISDNRFSISAQVTQWSDFEATLAQMRPDLVVVRGEIAPGPEPLVKVLTQLHIWHGIAIITLPASLRELRGAYEKAAIVRGVYIAPVNWKEVANVGYSAVMTERARSAAVAPLQEAYISRASTAVTGTRVVAFLSASGGTGRSTIAEALAYHLAARMNIRALLMSFDLPPAAVAHMKMSFYPNAMEFFARPGDGFQASIQSKEGMDILLAPENSLDYQRAAEYSSQHKSEPDSIYSLVMTSWTRNYAGVVLDLPSGENPWSLQGIAAANTAVIVARCTLADMIATRHMLVLLKERLAGEHRIPEQAIYLVLNQVHERSPLSPRGFHDELALHYRWAPPIAAVIPYNPAISVAQDDQTQAATRVEELGRGVARLAETLFPGFHHNGQAERSNIRSLFRLPRFRFT